MKEGLSKGKIIIIILAAALLIGGFGLVMHLIENKGIEDVQFGDTGEWGSDSEAEEILFLLGEDTYITNDNIDAYLIAGTDAGGTDKGEGYNGELADFITVMLIDNTTEKYAFYQIDRNTIVDVPIMGEDGDIADFAREQICTAHWYGRDADERNNNLCLAATELMGGLDMEGYYVLNMADVGAVNDAIGGVDIEIEEDMTDLDPAFTAGSTVHLTGKQAENYLRARMGVGDGTNAGRMRRQQKYMQKAYNMLISQLRENPEYINELYNELEEKVESDGTGKRVSMIARQVMEYECVGIITFDGETRIGDTIGEGIEHEEFYPDTGSIVKGLRRVVSLREYSEEDADADD